MCGEITDHTSPRSQKLLSVTKKPKTLYLEFNSCVIGNQFREEFSCLPKVSNYLRLARG
jgi:hypothetical protein